MEFIVVGVRRVGRREGGREIGVGGRGGTVVVVVVVNVAVVWGSEEGRVVIGWEGVIVDVYIIDFFVDVDINVRRRPFVL